MLVLDRVLDAGSYALTQKPRWVLFTVTVFLIPLFSYFVLFPFNIESDVRRGFAQRDGRAAEEFRKFSSYYNISYDGMEIWVVLVTPKRGTPDEGGPMNMSLKLLEEVTRLDSFITNLTVEYRGEKANLLEMQGQEINYLFRWYKYAYELADVFPSSINLTFPTASVFGHSFFLGTHFFGVNHYSEEPENGQIRTVDYVTLWYMSEAPTFEKKKKLEAIQMKLFELSSEDNFSNNVSFYMYADQVANAEMLRGTMHTVKLFVLGVLLMICFMMYMFNYLTRKSQITMIAGAIAAPSLATASCFAILGWTGYGFNSIMCITPFLIMGIGVDDAFLLLHSWRRHDNLHLSDHSRMRTVLAEIGPSMFITSITNALAFGIGILSKSPQMSGFCLCTAVAVMLDFFFEFVVFLPVMVIFYKQKNEKPPLLEAKKTSFSWEKYCAMLLSPSGRLAVFILTVFLYASAYVGVRELQPSFDPSKTFPADSQLLVALKNFERIQSEYTPLNFIARRLPDPSNSTEMSTFFDMVSQLENRPYCYGPERTQFMLRNYEAWKTRRNQTFDTYQDMPEFVVDRKIESTGIIQFHEENSTVVMDGINFIVICRGAPSWNTRAFRIDEARRVIDSYPQFNMSLFDYDSTIYDLIITAKDELIKAVLITFVCMTIACMFMIPSISGASIATLSMLSISFSLLGWLSIWGQNLDPVTMINVLMAIGFSVDFSAHICYHFHLNEKHKMVGTKNEKIVTILRAVGRPMIEASLSTLICMFPLFFVPVYIIISFARTVSLVAFLGLLHGAAIIPVVLSFLAKDTYPSPLLQQKLEITPMIKTDA